MTWTSSRSCSHSTVSSCLVQGSSATPPLNLSTAARSDLSQTAGAIFLFPFSSYSDCHVQENKKILTYFDIPRQKPTDFAYVSVTNMRLCRVASFSGEFAPFRPLPSNPLVQSLHVCQARCLHDSKRMSRVLQHCALNTAVTSHSVLIGQGSCQSQLFLWLWLRPVTYETHGKCP